MPVSRNQNILMYRKNGTRYAHGEAADLKTAMNAAKKAFLDEFGFEPKQEHEVYEIVGVMGGWKVTFLEVKWEE